MLAKISNSKPCWGRKGTDRGEGVGMFRPRCVWVYCVTALVKILRRVSPAGVSAV